METIIISRSSMIDVGCLGWYANWEHSGWGVILKLEMVYHYPPALLYTSSSINTHYILLKEEQLVKSLYSVTVVSKDEKILLDIKVVAEDVDEAKFDAGVHDVIKESNLKPRDVTVLCRALGEVRVKKVDEKVNKTGDTIEAIFPYC